MKKKFTRYILFICILCFGLLGIVSYKRVSVMIIGQSKKDAMDIAEVAASELSGEALSAITSKEDDEFHMVYNTLSKYRACSLIEYIYTMKLLEDKLVFVVDTDEEDPAGLMEEYEFLEDMKPAFLGEVCCDQKISKDRWGTYFSVYAPVFNMDGTVAGIVGCDIEITHIDNKLVKLRNLIIILVSLFGIALLSAYLILSHDMVSRDILTGVANYDKLLKVGHRLSKSGKLSSYTGLITNIKDFKYLNQQIGVNFGDEVLRQYAKKLESVLNKKEFIARTGNDNFFVLLLKGNEENFLKTLSNIEIKISDKGKENTYKIASRCGLYNIAKGKSINRVMNNCTLALNEARNVTSSDYVWYDEKLSDIMLAEKKVLSDFNKALENKEFVVYYQPKVDINNNRLCGAEALVRWIKDGKVVSPIQFIPVLEKEGKIIDLDFYVFRRVCEDLTGWLEMGIEPVRISSNFSKLHLNDEEFASKVLAIVNEYNIDTGYLEIELTESSGYSDFEALKTFVDCMKQSDIYTSMDDFGTGYSSLSMLMDINVDVVKIDKSFVNNPDGTNEKMLENVIHMIKDLDRIVICEGVETKQQADFLRETDCSIVQGYLYDKPLTHDEFQERLKHPDYQM